HAAVVVLIVAALKDTGGNAVRGTFCYRRIQRVVHYDRDRCGGGGVASGIVSDRGDVMRTVRKQKSGNVDLLKRQIDYGGSEIDPVRLELNACHIDIVRSA